MLGIIALGCFASQLMLLGTWSSDVVFGILAARHRRVGRLHRHVSQPGVLCRLVRDDAGRARAAIFMLQGAQFLGVATIVVYAGAILVTFLFVLMLAQPRGNAYLRPCELGSAAWPPAPAR